MLLCQFSNKMLAKFLFQPKINKLVHKNYLNSVNFNNGRRTACTACLQHLRIKAVPSTLSNLKEGYKIKKELLILLNNASTGGTQQNRNLSTQTDQNLNNDSKTVAPKKVELQVEISGNLNEEPRITFRAPKNILHNVYDVVARELKNNDLKINPVYKTNAEGQGKNSWTCTYNLKWPEPARFVANAYTKKSASTKAAINALAWLKKIEKITKEGLPIIIDKAEAQELKKQSIEKIALKKGTLELLNEIGETYRNEFKPKLAINFNKKIENSAIEFGLDQETDLNLGATHMEQKRLNQQRYLAKESINLPISAYKDEFMELLERNSVIIIKGEPGCGKSTRIPQYVLEAWIRSENRANCRIAVTQPRRIAAISLADRVSSERDELCGEIVGYQVRLKQRFQQKTGRILYCTTGILLRHLQSDPGISNFSHIILDEAHERDVNTDLLMNLLKSSLELNPNLKLVVMSATIDADKFSAYFDQAPVLHVPGFTFPVKAHFLDDLKGVDLRKTQKICETNTPQVVAEDVVNVINVLHRTKPEGAILCFLPGWEDISKVEKLLPKSGDMVTLCLHSRLQDSEQRKIFSRPPPGVRKIILGTNIAETSVTIDDVVYVVDTGVHKENVFDHDKGVECIDNHWISQASMKQRKGRAGRCQPGESFHLYTKTKYESMKPYTDPEILRTSLTKIVLDSKVFSSNMDAVQFMGQLLSPPEKSAIRLAVRELKDLKLLDENENLTHLGKALASFQLEPKLAKVLINSVVFKCVTPIVDIVTIFSSGTEIFAKSLHSRDKEYSNRIKRQAHGSSDHLALMRLFEKWLEIKEEESYDRANAFCEDARIASHKMNTIEKLRKIHFDYFNGLKQHSVPINDDFSDNDELVKAILFSGVGTVLQHRNYDIVKNRMKKSNVFLTEYNHRATITSESVNFKKVAFPSSLLVYINEVRSNIRRMSLVRECSVISPLAVLLFSNKNLTVVREGEDQVVLGLEGTKISFICQPSEAEKIRDCKEAIDAGYEYFIYQLTEGGEVKQDINFIWNQILENLNTILLKNRV